VIAPIRSERAAESNAQTEEHRDSSLAPKPFSNFATDRVQFDIAGPLFFKENKS
tara:strand:+ start:64 stop:225 length:162 start_codon:yes stop_codon:yes gene_type:complete